MYGADGKDCAKNRNCGNKDENESKRNPATIH
jgi:hypothetical protein